MTSFFCNQNSLTHNFPEWSHTEHSVYDADKDDFFFLKDLLQRAFSEYHMQFKMIQKTLTSTKILSIF